MEATRTFEPLGWLADVARRERGALAAVARGEGLSAEEALEAVQEALSTMVVRRNDAAAENTSQAVATLKTIVRNAARNQRRRHHRRLPHSPIEGCCDKPAPEPSPEEALVQAESLVRLRACVAELCGRERAVVTLRLLDERSGEDVARELGVTRAHVDVLVHRAKATLRTCVARRR